ncbi:hypothetical protein ABEB36_005196 [Hypothenemus hampei]|uniref:Uncharacterized protein n=1 Tax=Hypothenemus hampei TaxID=57062 RepID=A0ABD1EXC2_HYPHA
MTNSPFKVISEGVMHFGNGKLGKVINLAINCVYILCGTEKKLRSYQFFFWSTEGERLHSRMQLIIYFNLNLAWAKILFKYTFEKPDVYTFETDHLHFKVIRENYLESNLGLGDVVSGDEDGPSDDPAQEKQPLAVRLDITTMSVYDGAYSAIVMATPDVKHLRHDSKMRFLEVIKKD